MRERKILYYPTVGIPNRWLKCAVLYWDQVSSITSKEWLDDLDDNYFHKCSQDLESYNVLKYLKDQGVYQPTIPKDHYLGISKEFRERLRSSRFKKLLNKDWEDFPLGGSSAFKYFQYLKGGDISRIYDCPYLAGKLLNSDYEGLLIGKAEENVAIISKEKVDKDVIDSLVEYDLAKVYDDNYLIAEGNTILLYMALLAKYTATFDPNYTVIGTDWKKYSDYEDLIFGFDRSSMLESMSDIKRPKSRFGAKEIGTTSMSIVFSNILPIPHNDVDIARILKFKDKRKDELLKFRYHIDEIQKDLSKAENYGDIKLILANNEGKLELEVRNLRNFMKDLNIKTTMASSKSLIDIKQPFLWEYLILALKGSFLSGMDLPKTITIPLLGATAAIQIAGPLFQRRYEQRIMLRDSPYAYLYYAENERII